MASTLEDLAAIATRRGDWASAAHRYREAVPILKDVLARHRARWGDSHPLVSDVYAQRWLGLDPCATGAVAEGDSVIRAAIPHLSPDSAQSMPYRVRGTLGFCLTRQRRFAEAEPLLLQSEAGLRALASAVPAHRALAVPWLAHCTNSGARPAEAAAWSSRR